MMFLGFHMSNAKIIFLRSCPYYFSQFLDCTSCDNDL